MGTFARQATLADPRRKLPTADQTPQSSGRRGGRSDGWKNPSQTAATMSIDKDDEDDDRWEVITTTTPPFLVV